MATTRTFGPYVVQDTAGNYQPGATGAFYAITDPGCTTPLTVTTLWDGVAQGTSTSITASSGGTVEWSISDPSNLYLEGFFKSGSMPKFRVEARGEADTLNPGDPGTTMQAVVWNGSAYPSQPATMPGVTVRIAFGPEAPTYAEISGVADYFLDTTP